MQAGGALSTKSATSATALSDAARSPAALGRPPEATELLIDNRGVVDISHDPGAVPARSKHIHRRHFYVRELVQSGEFKTTFVPGDDNLADIFTKPLDTRKFLNLRARLMNLPMPRA